MLRTIGAQSNQIFKMTAVEYLILGILGSISGVALSIVGAFLLSTFSFKIPFTISWIPVITVPFVVTFAVALIGILNNREIMKTSPKEILRGS